MFKKIYLLLMKRMMTIGVRNVDSIEVSIAETKIADIG